MMYNIQGSIDGMYKLYRCQYWVGKKDKKKKFKIEYVFYTLMQDLLEVDRYIIIYSIWIWYVE
jgi:hypothetical protein